MGLRQDDFSKYGLEKKGGEIGFKFYQRNPYWCFLIVSYRFYDPAMAKGGII
jgi:hypothetical protein